MAKMLRRLSDWTVPVALIAVAALAWFRLTPAFVVTALAAFGLLAWRAWLAAVRQLEAANARAEAATELLRKVRDQR